MVNQKELLEILNRERDYEDRIAKDLLGYIDYSLDDAEGLSEEEKGKIRETLSVISRESFGHNKMFTKLIERCLEDEEIS